MADQVCYVNTDLPQDITNLISQHCSNYDNKVQQSATLNQKIESNARNSKHAWIPSTDWIAGFIYYYIHNINRTNFMYDLTTIDSDTVQYTVYDQGQYYHWHVDAGLEPLYTIKRPPTYAAPYVNDTVYPQADYIRKLSFSLQLSHPDDYTGGELQFLDFNDNLHTVSKDLGTLVVFDSRTKHRVTKVKSGQRKSLVGWVIGPRWK